MDREWLRRQIKEKRESLSKEEAREHTHHATEILFNTDFYKESKKIAIYFSMKQELNTQLIMQGILSEGKSCYLPKITSVRNSQMSFVEYKENDPCEKNKFGINEPCLEERKTIQVQDLDLVIAPLLAFDVNGNRLGMGAGYYDRALERKKEKPFFCGLAYSFQEIDLLPTEEWDVPLNAVVTEKDCLQF